MDASQYWGDVGKQVHKNISIKIDVIFRDGIKCITEGRQTILQNPHRNFRADNFVISNGST